MGAQGQPGVTRVSCVLLACAVAAAGCSNDPVARPQLVVVVDTDAPVVGQLAASPALSSSLDLSSVAAIDTVRIDLVRDDREVIDFRDFTAPDPRDWPLSFGVVSEAGGTSLVRLRIRGFRATRGVRGVLAGATTVEPLASLSIDRLVEIDLPASGIHTVRLVLSAACMGAAPSFQPPLRTCVDDARRDESPRAGVEEGAPDASLAGRSPLVAPLPCASESPTTAACIPGGLGVVGDAELDGLSDSVPISPPRPVLISPFHMDKTELTVGRYRALLNTGKVVEEPQPAEPGHPLRKHCTWHGSTAASQDGFPLNCISYAGAVAACRAVGGRLPTDAEWEYAARGRGLGRRFPWGDENARCCTASAGRVQFDGLFECSGTGVEPVMAHTDGAECLATADVSRDGIFDLGGSLTEATADEGGSLHDACWVGPGVVRDPRCASFQDPAGRFTRGGDWASGSFLTASAFRRLGIMPSNTTGFRCVYDDAR